MDDGFILHYPFKWLNGFEHEDFDGSIKSEPDINFQLKKTVQGDSEIVLRHLPSRPFAESCVYRCWFALMCFSVVRFRPCIAELSLAEPEPIQPEFREVLGQWLNADLSEVDSKVLGAVPFVRSSTERVKRLKMTLSGTVKRDAVNVAAELMEWMWHPHFDELINDKKLRLALELSNLVGYEAPKEAKFILIMSALEALLPEDQHPTFLLDKIADWQAELKAAKLGLSSPDEQACLQQLIDKTAFLKSPSIASRLRKLAETHRSEEDHQDFVKKVKQAYELRSTLVHQGECDGDLLTLVYPSVHTLLLRTIQSKLNTGTSQKLNLSGD